MVRSDSGRRCRRCLVRPALSAIVGGHTDVLISSLAPALSQIRAGKLKALAVTTKTRSASLPNVPTIAETVIPDFDMATWFGMLAPKGTPKPVVAYLNDVVNKVVEGPEVRKSLATLGVDGVRTNPERSVSCFAPSSTSCARWRRPRTCLCNDDGRCVSIVIQTNRPLPSALTLEETP